MEQLQELARQVRLLEAGSPQEVRQASQALAQFQRSSHALPLSLALLKASGAGFAGAFAAQTLAQRARLGRQEDLPLWPEVSQALLELLSTAQLARPALRQTCCALARAAVLLCDAAPDFVFGALGRLGAEMLPLLEFLQALSEEPFSRRLLVDGSRRSRFLMALRQREPEILAAINEALRRRCSEAELGCAAAWLRAQGLYEDWLPMVGVGSAADGMHPALRVLAPALENQVPQAARQLCVLPAAAQVLEAALPLATHPEAVRTVGPLLAALHQLSTELPGDEAALGPLLSALHGAFAQPNVAWRPPLRPLALDLGVRLLAATGPSSGLEVDVEGGLLGRCFDAWEALAFALREDCDADFEAEAFARLLEALPQAMRLSKPCDSSVRGRMGQLLTIWCGGQCCKQRQQQAVHRLERLASAYDWGALEMVLTLGSAVAEALAGDADELPVPQVLLQLLEQLPQVVALGAQADAAQSRLTSEAAAELLSSMDAWICPERFPGAAGHALLRAAFGLAESAGAPGAEALSVVVSNLAPGLAPVAEECITQLRHLILGANGLTLSSRQRLLRSALAPLLRRLERPQRRKAAELFLQPLREAARAQEASRAGRLLFTLLGADCFEPAEALEAVAGHWAFFEAALEADCEAACEAACETLEAVLTRCRSGGAGLQRRRPRCNGLLRGAGRADRGAAAAPGAGPGT
ncbi:unnamed protein product [Effrenium voratum]|uniref:Uncharacterized protein n=1 Tax=Effrenium voratum TaxID=2562239 RepID=A0AA36JDP7_9DINO|nr:unnamed protein product [Effrenium voratum]